MPPKEKLQEVVNWNQCEDPLVAMGLQNDQYKTLEIMLTGSSNRTLKGVLNFTAVDLGEYSEEDEVYDGTGAATFVIVVILVYGLSIVLMIASLAKKNMKLKDVDLEEKQIHRYLNQANDLREKGAKENYRQLKRTIITLVNNIPEGQEKNKQTTSVSNNILRSMIAVGSPVFAGMAENGTSNRVEKDGETSGHQHQSSHRTQHDSESLKALMEDDDEGSDDAQQRATSSVAAPDRRQPSVVSQHDFHPPKTAVFKQDAAGTNFVRVGGEQRRSPAAGAVPRVVVSELQTGLGRNRPPSRDAIQTGKSDGLLAPFEKDNKIICKVDERMLHEPGKSCKLSMDSDGNIWILQASPETVPRSPNRLTPSPALLSAGSLGYESLNESRTPSPNVFRALSPSPVATAAGSPRSGRTDRPRSPYLGATPRRDRSRSPGDRSRSPTPQPHPGACCEHRHSIIPTTTVSLLPSGRKSPHREQRDAASRENGHAEPERRARNEPVAPSTPTKQAATPAYGESGGARAPVLPSSDDEELVQITTV